MTIPILSIRQDPLAPGLGRADKVLEAAIGDEYRSVANDGYAARLSAEQPAPNRHQTKALFDLFGMPVDKLGVRLPELGEPVVQELILLSQPSEIAHVVAEFRHLPFSLHAVFPGFSWPIGGGKQVINQNHSAETLCGVNQRSHRNSRMELAAAAGVNVVADA